MPGASVSIRGVARQKQRLTTLKTDLLPQAELALASTLLPIENRVQTYPAQPPPKDPKRIYIRGVGSEYVPTGKQYLTSQKYGPTTFSGTRREGNIIIGFVRSPATYALFLRGDLNGEGQAWMHKDVWETLKTIRDSEMPRVKQRIMYWLSMWLSGI